MSDCSTGCPCACCTDPAQKRCRKGRMMLGKHETVEVKSVQQVQREMEREMERERERRRVSPKITAGKLWFPGASG